MKLITSLFLSLIILLQGCASLRPPVLTTPFDGNYSPITVYLSRYIERQMKKGGLTGLSLALVDGDRMVWSEGFGFADKSTGTKATAKTVYRAGSVSKLFNAVAIMQLVEQGKLDLDAPVVTYVPEFRINSRFGSTDGITLRSLLSHQSGMPSDMPEGMWSDDPAPLESLLEFWRESHVVNPANTIFNYSNTGISLSGLAVESVTGGAYEQHLQTKVLDFLEMEDSDFSGQLHPDNPVRAYLGKKEIKESPLRDTPAGGLNTTVNDLSKFLMAIHNKGRFGDKTLLEESTLNEMFVVQNEGRMIDMDLKVGLAWFHTSEMLGGRFMMVGHEGRTIAHSAKLVTAPKAGLGVIVLTNSADNSGAATRIAKEAMKQLYATRGLTALQQEDTSSVVKQLQPLAELTGDYAGPFNLISIRPDGKYFHGDGLGMKVSLRPETNNWHSVKVKLAGLTIQPRDLKSIRVARARIDGIDRLIGSDEGVPILLGDLIEPYDSTAQWDRLLGEYHLKNPVEAERLNLKEVHFKRAEHFYYIEVKDNQNNIVKSAIRPLNDSQFISLGTGRGLGETVNANYENDKPVISYFGLVFEQL